MAWLERLFDDDGPIVSIGTSGDHQLGTFQLASIAGGASSVWRTTQ